MLFREKQWFSTTKEVWQEVIGFSNYEISNFGNIRRSVHKNPRGRGWNLKKPGDPIQVCHSKLYPYVHIKSDEGTLKTKRISNLVCTASYGPTPDVKTYFALHKDDNPRNNHSSNLYWGTQKQNIADARRNGYFQYGELGPNSKFKDDEAAQIRARYWAGGTTFDKLAKEYNVAYSTIRNICNSKTYKAR